MKTEINIDLTILVTSYNEEVLVIRTLETILDVLQDCPINYEVIIIDDASRDSSVERIKAFIEHKQLRDSFRLIINKINQGIGVNYFRAAEEGRGTYFLIMHGDNALHNDALRSVLQLMGKADIILPYFNTKIFGGRHNWDHRPFGRRLLSVLFTEIIRIISGHNLHYFNGLALHRRINVLNNRVPSFGLGYQAELLCRLLDDPEVTFLEIRLHNYERREGSTTAFRFKNVISVGNSLWRILLHRWFSNK